MLQNTASGPDHEPLLQSTAGASQLGGVPTVLHPLLESQMIEIKVYSSLTGDLSFGPLQVWRSQRVSGFVRQLYHISHSEHRNACRIVLTCRGRILALDRSVMQYYAATEHMGAAAGEASAAPPGEAAALQSRAETPGETSGPYLPPELSFHMTAEPVLLTWEQLCAMPAMRKRAGRGGKGACIKQRQLREYVFKHGIDEVDLARSDYDWRLLLKTMPCLNKQDVIGPGVVGFAFRLLSNDDPNYAPGSRGNRAPHCADTGQRHEFELTCANGDRWLMHFHLRGSCDMAHWPFGELGTQLRSKSRRSVG